MAQNRLEMKVPSILAADRYERGGVMIKSNLPLFRHIFKDLMVAARASPIPELSIGSYQMEVGMKNWQRALNEWILGNGNLWVGQRSLIVGLLRMPFFWPIQDRIRNTRRFGKI